jgi:hypothetical protein
MAGPQHIPLHGSFHCSFSVAVRYLELRDLASAYETPDIFSLIDWPDGLLERFFWVLWDALERGSVHADLDKVQEISLQRWRGDRAQVEEWRRLVEHWREHGTENGLRFFIRQVAGVVAHAFIRVDELVAAFPPPKEESPIPELPEPALIASSYQASSQKVEPAPAPAKKLTPAQFDRLVAFAKKEFGGLKPMPGREVTEPALEAELGRPIVRHDRRAILHAAGVEGTRGAPRKKPAE